MPARTYAYIPFEELKSLAQSIARATVTGQTQEIRSNHTGFLRKTGPVSKQDLHDMLMAIRYEIYWRGKRNTEREDAMAASLEPTNPYREKIMRVESVNLSQKWILPFQDTDESAGV